MAVVGKPPEDIVDREEEVGRIVDSMTSPTANVNYALVGHRRIGKSTIMHEAKRRMESRGDIIVGYVDFGEFRHSPANLAESLTEELTEELTRAYSRTIPRSSRMIHQISLALSQISEIRKLRARFVASIDEHGGPRIEISPYISDGARDHSGALKSAFEYANAVSEASGKRVVIMIDEFQHVGAYRRIKGLEGILDIIRTALERRGENVSFVVSGSRVHYLREVLGQGGSPVFGHFVTLDIGPLQRGHAMELFARSCQAPATDKDAEDAYAKVGGHPYYLVMLAEAKRSGEPVPDAYERLLTDATGALYVYVNYVLTDDLGSNYGGTNYPAILTSIAEGSASVSEISRRSHVRLTDLPRLLRRLVGCDLVTKSGKKGEERYALADPVIRDFFLLVAAGGQSSAPGQ